MISFCDTAPSSKNSYKGSNSSLLNDEDSASSSGSEALGNDTEYEKLNRNSVQDDDDLESKMRWFLQRIE